MKLSKLEANDNRISILEGVAKEFSISAEVPYAFDGILVLNNMMVTFYAFSEQFLRKKN